MGVVLARPRFNSGGGGGGGGETFITSFTFRNDKGSTQSAGVLTYGQIFQIDDVAPGEILVLRNHADNSLIEHQAEDMSFFENGTRNRVGVHAWAPSVGAGGDITIDVYKTTGSYSQSEARPVTDITGQDYKLVLTSVTDNADSAIGSGNFTFAVNDRIGSNVRKFATGKFVNGWETWGFVKATVGGTPDTQIYGHAILEVISDPNGDYVDTRIVAQFGMPSPDVSSKRAFRGKMALYNGATLLKDYSPSFNFTSANVNTTNNTIALSGSACRSLMACRITTSGSILGGVTASRLYYLRETSAGSEVYTLHTNTRDARQSAGNNPVDITSGGSGTHTLTVFIELPYWASHLTLDRDADEIYVGGSKPQMRPNLSQTERLYCLKTGLIPPWSFDEESLSVDASDSSVHADYFPMSNGLWRQQINGTGGDEMIGVIPNWVGRCFATQDAAGWKNVKVNCAVQMHVSRSFVLDTSTGGIYCGNHGPLGDDTTPYENMAPPTPDLWYFTEGNKSSSVPMPPLGVGEAVPGSGGTQEGVFNDDSTGADNSHMPCATYMAYLFGQRRWQLRCMWGSITRMSFFANYRDFTYDGVDYCLPQIYGQQRAEGNKFREFALAGAVGEDSGEKQYARAMADAYAAYYHHMKTNYGTNFFQAGFWTQPQLQKSFGSGGGVAGIAGGAGAFWSHESQLMRFHYQLPAWVWAGAIYQGATNYEEMAEAAGNAAKRFVDEDYGTLAWLNAYAVFRNKTAGNWSDEPAPSETWLFLSNETKVTVATDGTWTFDGWTQYSQNLGVGDKFMLWDSFSIASGLAYGTVYKILTKPTNTTFTASLATDNVMITPAVNQAASVQTAWRPVQPSTGIVDGGAADHWAAGVMMVAGWATSLGRTDIDNDKINTRIDDVNPFGSGSGDFNTRPKFFMRGAPLIKRAA